jgi:hypothetical protein
VLLFGDGDVFTVLDSLSSVRGTDAVLVVTVEYHVFVNNYGVVDFYVGCPATPKRTAEETALLGRRRCGYDISVHFVAAVFDEHRRQTTFRHFLRVKRKTENDDFIDSFLGVNVNRGGALFQSTATSIVVICPRFE